MADHLLYSTLDGHIPLEELLAWISNKNVPESQSEFGCSRADFVLYFLNFLHQGTARTLPVSKCPQHGNRFASKVNQNETKGENLQRSCGKQPSQNPKFCHSPAGGGCSVTSKDKCDIIISLQDENHHMKICSAASYSSLSPQSESLDCQQRKLSPHRTWKEKDGINSFQESDSLALSPLSCSMTSDGSPQFTHIQRRVNLSKSFDLRSPGFASSSPDSGSRNPHKSSGFCLGDFIVKEGKGQKGQHGKKRLSLSPPKSPADSQGNVLDEVQSSNSNKKKHRRRINPTKLCEDNISSGFNDVQPFASLGQPSPFQGPVNMEPTGASNSFTEERNLLKLERLKLQGDQVASQTNSVGLTPVSKFTFPKYTVADPRKVTYTDELLKLSCIYCSILDANFIPNLMTELYSMLQLLVIQDHHLESVQDALSAEVETALENLTVEKKLGSGEVTLVPDDINKEIIPSPVKLYKSTEQYRSILLFSSVHNCVYFALKVLLHLKDVLGCLDRITLKLMLENERITDFAPDLTECLASLYATAISTSGSGQFSSKPNVKSNVAFQSETDNSSNFPCTQAFSSFRKQRDGFYELIRVWEANHMSPGWCFTSALGSRIRNLLQLCIDPTNYMHLARLFRLQLISTVHGEPSVFDEEGHEDTELEECLRGVDPDKLNRLRERLVTPHKSAGPRPPPSFPGVQEFYRDFIVCAYNSAFLQHLQDGLVSHLLELNQTGFVASDMEESDLSVDEVTRHEFISTLSTMQLLAKFLGFVVFYPYNRPDVRLSDKIVEREIALRSKVLPPIDVLGCVIEAYKNHRLIVTVPWIVKYLGMMDVVSSALPICHVTLRLLLFIYISLSHKSNKLISFDGSIQEVCVLPTYSILLLRLCLGWLFEASAIQDTFFYSLCFNADDCDLLDVPDLRNAAASELSLSALKSYAAASLVSNANPPVDALNLVDGQVLYALCPYLLELRAPLTSAPVTRSTPRNSVRHITPVSTSFSSSSPSSTAKQLELQLEESFFHNLPASVHRTVEFVEERVTSLCVKHICNVWLRGLKEKGILKLREKIESSWDDLDTAQDSLFKEVQTIVDEVSAELKLQCRSGINEVCFTKCKGALMSLLSEESLSPAVCGMCVAIATRTCVERVVSWIQTHATLSMYSKDLQSEIDKALKHRDRLEMLTMAKTSHIAPGANATWEHNDSAPSPVQVLQALKLLVCNTLDGQDAKRENIEDILDKIKLTVTGRQDVVPAAERVLALLSVDLVVALACHFPSMLDSALLNRMVNLWKLDALRPVEDGLARLVCPRNMLLLAQSHHPPRIVWEKLADVVVAVLKAELVTPDLVENQCLAIMQQEWPQNILRCFSMCMTEVVRQYQKQRDVDYKFVLLLEWLAETMAQIEYFPDL